MQKASGNMEIFPSFFTIFISEIFDIDITSIHKWTVKLQKEGYKSLINKAKHQGGINTILAL